MGSRGAKLPEEEVYELVQRTNFSNAEIADWYRAFMKDCPSGQLTKQDFAKVYEQYYPFGNTTAFSEFVFRNYDHDKDGYVNFEDFITAVSVSCRGNVDEKLEWAFTLYDLDSDEFISRSEMTQIVDAIYKMIGSLVMLPDDESTAQKYVMKIFNEMDLDGDGKLSLEEFKNGCMKNRQLYELLYHYQPIEPNSCKDLDNQ